MLALKATLGYAVGSLLVILIVGAVLGGVYLVGGLWYYIKRKFKY